MDRRRGSRHRRRGGRTSRLVVGLIVLLVVGGTILPILPLTQSSSAFSSASYERGSSVPVAADETAVLALDEASAVSAGNTSRLVNVTNNFGRPVTVEVRLRAQSQDDADLVVDGTNVGDTASFRLDAGASQQVDAAVKSSTNLTDSTVFFDTSATATGVKATVTNRSVPIT